jgi:hypothetical protein
MNITQLHERADIDRCSVSKCRKASCIVYRPGASPANKDKIVGLCDKHHAEFCLMPESKHREKLVDGLFPFRGGLA